jgi:hypothetical protein
MLITGMAVMAQPPTSPPPDVTICHKAGTPAEKTMTLPYPGALGHINGHGDTMGACAPPVVACGGVFDTCIDTDGTATAGDGLPGAADVMPGTLLTSFPATFNNSGLDWFDTDGNGTWTLGPAGDDLHVEDFAFCPGANRDAIHDFGVDCKVLDIDGSLLGGEFVFCDLEVGGCPGIVKFHDKNGNTAWDDGEDIVLDANGNSIFD